MPDGATPASLRAFYQRYLDCCNAREFDRLGEFVAPDVVVNGEPQHLEQYTEALRAVAAASDDYRWDVHHVLVDGDWIAAHLVDSGTHTGTFLGVPATGRAMTTQEFGHYRVTGGRIVEVWVTADDLRLLRQLQ